MSLQVWLPLTKDLRQQGLSDIIPINNGDITYSSTGGKLGGCYIFDGVDDAITIGNLSTLVIDNFSFACWFYHDDTWSSKNYETIFGGPSGFELETKNGSTQSPVIRAYSWGGSTFTYELNKWNHLVMTRTTSETKFYLNGELKLTGTAGTIPSGNYFIGSWSSTTGQNFKGKVNDVRIYDHCLSPMEVKELSKGLVLHYPLNRGGWGQENLITNSQLNGSWTYPSSSYSDKYSPTTTIIPSGSVYTLSFDAKSTVTGDTIVTHYYSPNTTTGVTTSQGYTSSAVDGYAPFTLTTDWQRYWVTYTQSSTTAVKHLICPRLTSGNGTGIVLVRNVKFEEGSIATPWCPNSSDALATTMGLNGITEYDCSGFCNNGTQWAYDTVGTISYTSDTPKYQVSTYINSDNNTTNTASGTQYIYGNCELTAPQYLTVAFWCKPIAGYGGQTGQGQFSLTNNNIGADAGSDYQGGPMNHRDTIIDINGSNGTTHKTVSINFTANEWHHYVVVYDGRYARVYKDGVATATADMGSVMALGSMKGAVIGFSKAGGVWRSNKSYYSDFRIYATALSADDVKSLYQNSAYIDSSGNVYGAIHSEV